MLSVQVSDVCHTNKHTFTKASWASVNAESQALGDARQEAECRIKCYISPANPRFLLEKHVQGLHMGLGIPRSRSLRLHTSSLGMQPCPSAKGMLWRWEGERV